MKKTGLEERIDAYKGPKKDLEKELIREAESDLKIVNKEIRAFKEYTQFYEALKKGVEVLKQRLKMDIVIFDIPPINVDEIDEKSMTSRFGWKHPEMF